MARRGLVERVRAQAVEADAIRPESVRNSDTGEVCAEDALAGQILRETLTVDRHGIALRLQGYADCRGDSVQAVG
jgi:hypothetical protein